MFGCERTAGVLWHSHRGGSPDEEEVGCESATVRLCDVALSGVGSLDRVRSYMS